MHRTSKSLKDWHSKLSKACARYFPPLYTGITTLIPGVSILAPRPAQRGLLDAPKVIVSEAIAGYAGPLFVSLRTPSLTACLTVSQSALPWVANPQSAVKNGS